MKEFKINEIFYSICGESSFSGKPFIFVRFSGCNLNCSWCDTKYAFKLWKIYTENEILNKIKKFPIKNVCLTGGEPLIQDGIISFINKLISRKYCVSIETNGSINISKIPKEAHIIMDLKPPSSKMCDKNNFKNLKFLKDGDDIKFIILNRNDYNWAKNIIKKYTINKKINIFFMPVYGKLDLKILANWILKDCLNVQLQLQIHKIIGIK